MSNVVSIVPKSLCLCERCKRTPIRTSTCHVCLRTLLDEVIDQRDHHRQPDVIHTHVSIKFDWWDRLKVLLRGEARVSTRTQTQFSPGRVGSESSVHVPPLVRTKGGPMAELTAGKPK